MENKRRDEKIRAIIQKLASKNGLERNKAREELVKKGEVSIPYLLKLTDDPKHILRWESMKSLVQIGSPSTLPLFLEKLQYDEGDIRWLAAEGLIRIGAPSVPPLLNLILEKSDSIFVLSGAHHVIHHLMVRKKLSKNFPAEKLLSYLKVTTRIERLKLVVHEILNEMEYPPLTTS